MLFLWELIKTTHQVKGEGWNFGPFLDCFSSFIIKVYNIFKFWQFYWKEQTKVHQYINFHFDAQNSQFFIHLKHQKLEICCRWPFQNWYFSQISRKLQTRIEHPITFSWSARAGSHHTWSTGPYVFQRPGERSPDKCAKSKKAYLMKKLQIQWTSRRSCKRTIARIKMRIETLWVPAWEEQHIKSYST